MRLAASGVRELNLIAQDLTAYGRDLKPRVVTGGAAPPPRANRRYPMDPAALLLSEFRHR